MAGVDGEKTNNDIKPIDAGVSHRICSGQVIVTLSTAVKELVENSLDAGATNIDIRLVEFGSKLIQVKDNGPGVEERNFAGLARKHHTSKLREFDDLESIGTFGFRGEALSSLCALSQMTVTTKSDESKQGFEIEYNHQGEIVKCTTVARQRGTTVTLQNIFSTLPVRHKEFLKHLKREFNRMTSVLYGYSVMAKGVRISCSHETKGNSSNVLCVPAADSTKERILSVFGAKQVASLVEINSEAEISDGILAEFGLSRSTFQEMTIDLTGWISGPNSGRSSADRQFYFINTRPFDSPKVSRLVNEVYHTFSRSHFPFIYLNVETTQKNVDVNVTPDKRSIFMQNEKLLYAKIKGTIHKTLMDASSTFSPSQSTASGVQTKLSFSQIPTTLSQPFRKIENDDEEPEIVVLDDDTAVAENSSTANDDTTVSSPPFQTSSAVRFGSQPSAGQSKPRENSPTVRSFLTRFKFGNGQSSLLKRPVPPNVTNAKHKKNLTHSSAKQPKLMDFMFKTKQSMKSCSRVKESELIDLDLQTGEDEVTVDISDVVETDPSDPVTKVGDPENCEADEGCSLSQETDSSDVIMEDYSEDYCDVENRLEAAHLLSKTVRIDWPVVFSKVTKVKKVMDRYNMASVEERSGRKFLAKISPDQNSNAEKELKQSLSKEMFKQMELIGQFNLGFIITKINSDLFIIDQHAADEKYNYEHLEKQVTLRGQRLIIPMPLDLTNVSENILIENLTVFEKNGFSFNIKENGTPTQRISLTKIPFISKSCHLGKEDVDELIFLLQDAPEKSFYRPTKVKTLIASRACRKSVMIGDKLNLKSMRRVVGQLGEIEQPWNCPHGRPTLRHLFNLDLLPDSDWFQI